MMYLAKFPARFCNYVIKIFQTSYCNPTTSCEDLAKILQSDVKVLVKFCMIMSRSCQDPV